MSMKDKARCHFLVLTAGLALGGCAVVAPNGTDTDTTGMPQAIGEAPEREQSVATEISALASYGETLNLLSPESQRQELEEAERELKRGDGSMERLRLALLLTLADEELQDLERARVLIAEAVVAPEHAAQVGLARLMAMLVAELQAAQQALEQAAQEQHDDDGMLAEERAECEALQERLARLKDIEKQLNDRAQPSTLAIDDDPMAIDDDSEPTQNPPGRR